MSVLKYFGRDLGVGSRRLLRSYVEGNPASNAKPGYIIGEGEERGKDMDRYWGVTCPIEVQQTRD
jgi:hypothetical protein